MIFFFIKEVAIFWDKISVNLKVVPQYSHSWYCQTVHAIHWVSLKKLLVSFNQGVIIPVIVFVLTGLLAYSEAWFDCCLARGALPTDASSSFFRATDTPSGTAPTDCWKKKHLENHLKQKNIYHKSWHYHEKHILNCVLGYLQKKTWNDDWKIWYPIHISHTPSSPKVKTWSTNIL